MKTSFSFLSSHYPVAHQCCLAAIGLFRLKFQLIGLIELNRIKNVFSFFQWTPLEILCNRLQSPLRSVAVGRDGGSFLAFIYFFLHCQFAHHSTGKTQIAVHLHEVAPGKWLGKKAWICMCTVAQRGEWRWCCCHTSLLTSRQPPSLLCSFAL